VFDACCLNRTVLQLLLYDHSICTGVKDGDSKWRCQDSVVCIEAHSAAAATTTAAVTPGAAANAAGTTDTSSARSVFAVFDGHGSKGREASALCAARLEKALTARLTHITSSGSSGNPACSLSSVGVSFSGSSASLSINGSAGSTATSSPYSSITSSSSNSSDKIGPVGCALAHVCWQLQKELQSTPKLDCANVRLQLSHNELHHSAI
jgi:hypothetical protein